MTGHKTALMCASLALLAFGGAWPAGAQDENFVV
jgi:hypothetical protein